MKHFHLWMIGIFLLMVSTLCWSQGTWRSFIPTDGLEGNRILGIFEDKDRNLWIQTRSGLFVYDGQFRTVSAQQIQTSAQLIASDGSIWVANDRSVTRYEGGTEKTFTAAQITNGVYSGLGNATNRLYLLENKTKKFGWHQMQYSQNLMEQSGKLFFFQRLTSVTLSLY